MHPNMENWGHVLQEKKNTSHFNHKEKVNTFNIQD
jgi:hypothetical protein